jgi:hypothetical protein
MLACWICRIKKPWTIAGGLLDRLQSGRRSRRRLARWLAFGLAAATLAAGGIQVARMRRSTAPPMFSWQPPDDAGWIRLLDEASVVPLAVDLASARELDEVSSAKFGIGYPRLLREKRVVDVPANSRAEILEEEKTHIRVAVESEGRRVEGWIPRSWALPLNPEFVPTVREPVTFPD